MKAFLKFIGFLALVPIVIFLFFFIKVLIAPTERQDARMEKRQQIEFCWKDYERKSHDASTKQFIAGACEKLEAELKNL